ncbi:MAG: hypothetical protein K2H41_14050 [Acetatifactor sp.]|nr:hypothetical protein [Acetatifactor sp.]
MVTISVVDRFTNQKRDCYDFECICRRDPGDSIGYFVFGFFQGAYFSCEMCCVFYSTDVNDALNRLDVLKSRLAKAKQNMKAAGSIAEGVTV